MFQDPIILSSEYIAIQNNNKKLLDDLAALNNDLCNTTKTNEKVGIIKKHFEKNNTDLPLLISYIHDTTYKQFGIKAKSMQKNLFADVERAAPLSIFEILDKLANREVTGHAAISLVKGLMSLHPEHIRLIEKIIERNLENGAGDKLFNKVIEDLIPQFDVALGHQYKPKLVKGDDWFVSRKLDGVRCIILVNNGTLEFWSRNGKPINNMEIFSEWILEQFSIDLLQNYVLDGELCWIEELENGEYKEDFKEISRRIRLKDAPMPIKNLRFCLFDCLTKEEFIKRVGTTPLMQRIHRFQSMVVTKNVFNQHIKILPQFPLEKFDEMVALAEQNGWEGLILRKNTGYQGKRSNDILKYKEMHDAEFKVIDVITGQYPYVVEENGVKKEIREEMLNAIIINVKGHPCKVGSGFNISQRQHWYKNPEELIGKIVTVQYFEESQDQNGKPSLRFPIFKILHGESREV